MEKKILYKWANGQFAKQLLMNEGGKDIYDVVNFSWAILYIPFNGGAIESTSRCMDYIKAHGVEIKPKEILDDVEREYLSNVCRPFMDKITSIIKTAASSSCHAHEFIKIDYLDNNYGTYTMSFPNFTKGTMYKGMELDKIYTPKDLNLK